MGAAARRWPGEIRDGMAAEWRAELAVLRGDPAIPSPDPVVAALDPVSTAGDMSVTKTPATA